jgi:regulator of sigma D
MIATTQRPQTDRRGRSLAMINKLVDSRTEMLTLYTQLAQQKPYTTNAEVPAMLEEFCEALVDYAANAHFQLYRYFAEKNERRQEIYVVAETIYPSILEITNKVLDFNDKYDCDNHTIPYSDLEKDLSYIGEFLADRIELEDRLISAFGYSFAD